MAEFDFQNIRRKAKKFAEEGLKIVRAGMQGAEVVAEATVDATKHHVQSRRSQVDLYRALHDLGEQVFTQVQEGKTNDIKMTAQMEQICDRVVKLQKSILESNEHLSRITIVGKQAPKKALSQHAMVAQTRKETHHSAPSKGKGSRNR